MSQQVEEDKEEDKEGVDDVAAKVRGARHQRRVQTAGAAILPGACDEVQEKDPLADQLAPVLAQALRRELRQLRSQVRDDIRQELQSTLKFGGRGPPAANGGLANLSPLPPQPPGAHNWLHRAPRSALAMEELKELIGNPDFALGKSEGKNGPKTTARKKSGKEKTEKTEKTEKALEPSDIWKAPEPSRSPPPCAATQQEVREFKEGDYSSEDQTAAGKRLSQEVSPPELGPAEKPAPPQAPSVPLYRKRMSSDSNAESVGQSTCAPVVPQCMTLPTICGDDMVSEVSSSLDWSDGPLWQQIIHNAEHMLRVIVCHSRFEYFSGVITIANAITLGFQTDYRARHVSQSLPAVFIHVELFFTMVFTIELLLRLSVHHCQFFYMKGWRWNVMDCVVVVMQLTESVMILTADEQDNLSSVSMLRTMRILRLSRSIRVVRALRYLDDLRTVMVAVQSAMKPLCSVMILVLFIIYATAIYFTELMTVYRVEGHPAKEEFDSLSNSLALTMLRLFQAITGGMEWDDFCKPMMNHISPFMGLVFSAYIVFMTLAILNIVTGVFVEAAMKRSHHEKNLFMINNLRELFYKLDLNRNGTIAYTDFLGHCDDPRLRTFLRDIDLDVSEAKGLFQLLDKSGCGIIDADEFLSGCLHLRGPARALDMHLLMRELIFLRTTAHEQLEDVQAVRQTMMFRPSAIPSHGSQAINLESRKSSVGRPDRGSTASSMGIISSRPGRGSTDSSMGILPSRGSTDSAAGFLPNRGSCDRMSVKDVGGLRGSL